MELSNGWVFETRDNSFGCSTIVVGLRSLFIAFHTCPMQGRGSLGPNSYCGVSSVYAGARLLGQPVDFASLLKPDFIGSPDGSSVAELRAAASNCGLETALIVHGDCPFLFACRYPVILYIKKTLADKEYNYFALYVGRTGDKLQILDAEEGVKVLSPAELVQRWSGVAIVLSRGVPNLVWPRIVSAMAFVAKGLVTIACVWLLALVGKALSRARFTRRGGQWRPLWGAFAIVFISIVVGTLFNLSGRVALITARQDFNEVLAAHVGNFVPRVGLGRVRAAVTSHAPIIDARYQPDYDAGHVPGAISIPVNLNTAGIRKELSRYSPSDPIIIYCESLSCPFSESIAARVINLGHRNVYIYQDGWVGWIKAGGERGIDHAKS
jgi:rhodanese-related sulfurtransferase